MTKLLADATDDVLALAFVSFSSSSAFAAVEVVAVPG